MDYRSNSNRFVGTRLFRPEHQFKLSTDRQLGSCSDRNRRHPDHTKSIEGNLTLSIFGS